jgi:tRNA (adenine22-N1)-methyltransferase
MKCAINARLLSAAKLTRQDAIFADIGTDHAYLPLFLLQTGRIKSAFCADINEGPLASARQNAEERGLENKIEFLLTDGAAALSGRGITDYAICGMGGELICEIIDRAPHLMESGVNLILQPMSKQKTLRSYLLSHGFEIKAESYSYDAGKYYVCLLATYSGKVRQMSEIEAELGAEGAEYFGDGERVGYLKAILAARLRAYNGKIKAGRSEIPEEELIRGITDLLHSLEGRK